MFGRSLLATVSCCLVLGQTQPPVAPGFEVASIRACPNDPSAGRTSGGTASSPDRLHLNCQTLMSLIRWAYVDFANSRFNPWVHIPISGGPAWINTDRYEVNAKAESPQGRGANNGPMLRALLEDRFKLKIRRETREVPIYVLSVAKDDAKLHASREEPCIPVDLDNPAPPPGPSGALPRLCGFSRVTSDGFEASGMTMGDFCRNLSAYLDRNVVDKTGIAGIFDIRLELSAADLGRRAPSPDDPAGVVPPDPGDIFSAMGAALGKIGLRLDSAKGPGEFLIIDRVERPSEN